MVNYLLPFSILCKTAAKKNKKGKVIIVVVVVVFQVHSFIARSGYDRAPNAGHIVQNQ